MYTHTRRVYAFGAHEIFACFRWLSHRLVTTNSRATTLTCEYRWKRFVWNREKVFNWNVFYACLEFSVYARNTRKYLELNDTLKCKPDNNGQMWNQFRCVCAKVIVCTCGLCLESKTINLRLFKYSVCMRSGTSQACLHVRLFCHTLSYTDWMVFFVFDHFDTEQIRTHYSF